MTAISQLLPLLVDGYADKCKELGIIKRSREIKTPEDLMLLCLYHLGNGCSLMDISVVAKLLKIANISDVAFMKKFAQCSDWFEWISRKLLGKMVADYSMSSYLQDYRSIAFDATIVTEKGAIGRIYPLHYGIDIFDMSGVSYKITNQEVGEIQVEKRRCSARL